MPLPLQLTRSLILFPETYLPLGPQSYDELTEDRTAKARNDSIRTPRSETYAGVLKTFAKS
jgi:hypothetical protein